MRSLIALACLAMPAIASATTIVELGPAALEAGADRIVEGRVIASASRWNADHTLIETIATLSIERTRKGASATTIDVVVPGGTVGNARQIVFGTPSVGVGEHARWFLAGRGDGSYRVYGWAQGKWPARGRSSIEFVRDPIAAERDTLRFATNGMVWPASEIPVRYLIQTTGSEDLSLDRVIAAFDGAFDTWGRVATAGLSFQNAGMTSLGLDSDDDTNVMLFIESGWPFGAEAAAATSLVIIDGQQTADIAVNGQHFRWAVAPVGAAINGNTLDLQAVMTHEIGHFSGLGHTDRSYDTMYFSWKPWPGQRSLSIDDKRGLTSLYPSTGDECAITATCDLANGETCQQFAEGTLCGGEPEPVGTPCNYDRVECDAFCLFTAADLSAGYCSQYCEVDTDCPLTHHCDSATAGSTSVKVCFDGAQSPPPPPCSDETCSAGEFCDADTGACTFECRSSADCGSGLACSENGRCVEADGGCSVSERSPAAWLVGLWLACLLARRRATSRRSS